ncbi:MAG: O-methyltransferase [Gemmatimonadales bacterium]|nr:O-methyltransferase [Gemmatimonadales bacterium]
MEERIVEYVRALFAPEDEVLVGIRARHEKDGLPLIFISPEEAKIITVLLAAVGARRVLEVGTLGGYSGVWIARSLPPGGVLVTIERDPAHAQVALEAFAAAGVADRVDLRVGEARDVLATLQPPFDAVFLDADKPPLGDYFHEAMRLLRRGGLLLCDNAFIHGRVVDAGDAEPDVEGVRTLNRLAASDRRLVSAIVPVRDGLTIGVKVGD